MKANPAEFEVLSPGTLAGVFPLLPEYVPIAGGTEIMVHFGAGQLTPRRFVNIWNLPELRRISVSPDAIRIGAGSTFTDIRRHLLLEEEFPLLAQAAGLVGSIANQNRATLGGNLVNASPAADSSPPLLVYEAELELLSGQGVRRVPYSSFHLGYKETALRPGELLGAVILPRKFSGWVHFFRKVGARNALAISKVVFAGLAKLEDRIIADVRIAVGSVSYAPLRCPNTERWLQGRSLDDLAIEDAGQSLAKEMNPIDDIRSTADYRSTVAGNLLAEFLTKMRQRA